MSLTKKNQATCPCCTWPTPGELFGSVRSWKFDMWMPTNIPEMQTTDSVGFGLFPILECGKWIASIWPFTWVPLWNRGFKAIKSMIPNLRPVTANNTIPIKLLKNTRGQFVLGMWIQEGSSFWECDFAGWWSTSILIDYTRNKVMLPSVSFRRMRVILRPPSINLGTVWSPRHCCK